jgi:hypothetical protein
MQKSEKQKLQLTEEEREEIDDNFDSHRLLDAIDQVDKLRSIFGDRDINRPPEIREDLMDLHSVVFDAIAQGSPHPKEMKIWDMASDIESYLDEAREAIDEIQEVLTALIETMPERVADLV